MWEIIEMSATIFESYIAISFITNYFKVKSEKNKIFCMLIGIVFFSLIVMAMNNVVIYEGVLIIFYIIALFLYETLFLESKSNLEQLFVSCLTVLIVNLVNVIILYIVTEFTKISSQELLIEEGSIRFIAIIITKIIFLIITRCIIKLKYGNELSLNRKEWVGLVLGFGFSIITIIFIFEIIIYSNLNENCRRLGIISVGGILVMDVIFYVMIKIISIKNQEDYKYEILQAKLSAQERNIKETENSYLEMRKIRHDMKELLESSLVLLNKGKIDDVKEKLSEVLNKRILTLKNCEVSSSDFINAILNSKISECEENNIIINYEIKGDINIIDEIDSCMLIGNLLSNSIEASKKIHNRKFREINLKMQQQNDYLVIEVENSIEQSVLENNPKLITTKKDSKNHGIGMTSIKSVVEKYNGDMKILESENRFKVEILIFKKINFK